MQLFQQLLHQIVHFSYSKQFCTWWLESFIISFFKFQIVVLTTLFWNFQHVRKGTNVLCTWRSFKNWGVGEGGGGETNFMKWLVAIIFFMVNASCIWTIVQEYWLDYIWGFEPFYLIMFWSNKIASMNVKYNSKLT
jgi:hypothetical protein